MQNRELKINELKKILKTQNQEIRIILRNFNLSSLDKVQKISEIVTKSKY